MSAQIINIKDIKKVNEKIINDEYTAFLKMLENNLSKEDYLDFLESCVSIVKYNYADKDIKNLVDTFYNRKEYN
jgi:hypothetical protein